MFEPKNFSFDVEKMTEFFKQNDFTKHLANLKMPGMDADAMMKSQQKNMDALVEANKAAAAGYQDLFKKQIAIFEETMAGLLEVFGMRRDGDGLRSAIDVDHSKEGEKS
jgi:hypothetical protein